jgi:hypothetical protein
MDVKMAKEKRKMAVLPRSATEKYTHQEIYIRYVAHADEVRGRGSRKEMVGGASTRRADKKKG